MSTRRARSAATLIAITMPAFLSAQHHEHQPAAAQPSPQLAQCTQVQPVVENILTAATERLESARQTNDPAQLRAAIDHLQGALRDLRTQLAPCAAAAATADPHAGHAMPPATSPTATPVDPHAGHTMPPAKTLVAPPAKAPAAPPAKRPAAVDPHAGHTMPAPKTAPKAPPKAEPKVTKPKTAADPHAGHEPSAPPKPADKQRDPVTGLMVDPTTAPTTTYLGQTYYFSSEASKKEFLENPAKFAKKPGK